MAALEAVDAAGSPTAVPEGHLPEYLFSQVVSADEHNVVVVTHCYGRGDCGWTWTGECWIHMSH